MSTVSASRFPGEIHARSAATIGRGSGPPWDDGALALVKTRRKIPLSHYGHFPPGGNGHLQSTSPFSASTGLSDGGWAGSEERGGLA